MERGRNYSPSPLWGEGRGWGEKSAIITPPGVNVLFIPSPLWGEGRGGGKERTMETKHLTTLARKLRRRQTEAERSLWMGLRNRQLEGVKFRRQQPIGPYIVDFVSTEKRLIVEVDGGQHNEEGIEGKDEERTLWLKGQGYRVLRFWNNEVLSNIEGVLERIRENLK